jgi:cell division protein FtsI (penicillin-binding protein 3)
MAFFILLTAGVIAGVGFTFREQLENLIEVWNETFTTTDLGAADTLRGTIFDRNLKELAQTLERVSLYVRPREVTNVPWMAEQLAAVVALPVSEILEALKRDSHLVWLRRDIAQNDEERLAELNLPGVYFHREFARSYPGYEKASRIIGYSENDHGLTGVEHFYNRLLGNDRIRQEDLPNVDLGGLERTSDSGHDLVLTLDMKIQSILEEYVADLGNDMGSGQIASLLLNTADGKIVGGADYPSYNPYSVWQQDHDALESLLFTPMVIPEPIRMFFREASLLQGGWEQGTQVYPWSLVSGEMDLARQIRLWDRLQLSTEISVDFSGGKRRQTPIPQFVECRKGIDCGAVPKTATPLKVLLGMSHLLNGGVKIQPHVLDRVMEHSSQNEFMYRAFPGNSGGSYVFPSLVSQELCTLLQSYGKEVVLGTRILSGETVSLITDYSGGRYVRDRMSLIVVSGASPELILLIVSRYNELGPSLNSHEEPGFLTKGINSILPSMVALQQVNVNLADMMEFPEAEEKNFNRGQQKRQEKPDALASIQDPSSLLMPDLKGLSLRKGLRLMQRTDIRVHSSGSGRVVSQTPKAGEKLVKGGIVTLILKNDSIPEDVSHVESMPE